MTVTIDGTNGITTPSPVVVQGSTSGTITLAAPAVAGSNTQTLVATTGTLAPIVSGTAVASTSGTSIDFTGIPSWVKRITVMFSGVSTNGGGLRLQLGSGSAQTSGYNSIYFVTTTTGASNATNVTSGFDLASFSATDSLFGQIVFCLLGSNIWTGLGGFTNPNAVRTLGVSGAVTLSGTLDRVRITTVNGTDTFDAGSINILYE